MGADERRGGCREEDVAVVGGERVRGEEGGHDGGRAAVSAGARRVEREV